MNKQSFKGFYRFSDLDSMKYSSPIGKVKEQFNIVQKVPDDGVEYEFMISFYEVAGVLAARAEIFDESFCAFETHSELFSKLSEHETITPDELEGILISLGYIDLTRDEAQNDGKKVVYVCYVKNDMGTLQGEEVISCMVVTDNQKGIDEWLEKRFADAEEKGYFSDKDINTFKGKSDYTIPLSKANDKEGYDFYYLVCTPTIIK